MKSYLLLILLALYQLAGCQPVKDKKQPQEFSCPTEGFCIQDSLLFYNGKKIPLSLDVNSLIPALGNYDRVIEDKWGGGEIKDYYWFKDKIKANKHYDSDEYLSIKYKVNEETNQFVSDNKYNYESYTSLEEIEKKYGKYDSLHIEYLPLRAINRFYSWDGLGIQAVSVNDSLRQLTLLVELKNIVDYQNDPRYPKDTYKSKITINGVTLDLTKKGTDTWSQSMKALGILSKEYAPAGDTKDWTRYLKLKYFFLSFDRDAKALNKLHFPNQSIPDYINQVSIGINTKAFDKLKKGSK